MLERIGPAERGDALILLQWLAYAMRPVTLAELQTAVIIRTEDDEVDAGDEGDLGDSLSILSGLIVFSGNEASDHSPAEEDQDREHDTTIVEVKNLTPMTRVRLAHFSVKEYLESTRITGSSASFFGLEAGVCHRFLSQSCLTYLMHYSSIREEGSLVDSDHDTEDFPLLQYAASQWHRHSRRQSGGDVSRELALLACDKAKTCWARSDYRDEPFFDDGSCGAPGIYYAVEVSLPRVAEELLEAGEDVNATGPYGDPLLVIATKLEDEAMVKLLLAHGADINRTNKNHKSDPALYWAARSASLLTKLLLDNGSDVNLKSFPGTALSVACEEGHQWVVQLLLERGVQVNIVDMETETALTMASRRGHKEIVRLLIAAGADVNLASRHHTPLCEAARSGHTEIVAMLIEAGADPNAEDSGALVDALQGGYEHTVALLEAGSANRPTLQQLNNLLAYMCMVKHDPTTVETAIDLLLDRGADINAALSVALSSGLEHTVALLEARGANKPTPEQLNDTLIEVCCDYLDPREAVGLLLDRGADVNAEDSLALLCALQNGHGHAAALLEAKGAKKLILEQLNEALIETCNMKEHWQLGRAVELLLDRGADVNAENSRALLCALRQGHKDAVALLEAKSAKKLTSEQLKEALVEACYDEDHLQPGRAVRMLLDRGADVNGKDSALLGALRYGHEDAVTMLERRGANKPTLKQLNDALVEVREDPDLWNFESAVQMLLNRGADDLAPKIKSGNSHI